MFWVFQTVECFPPALRLIGCLNEAMTARSKCWLSALIGGCLHAACLSHRRVTAGTNASLFAAFIRDMRGSVVVCRLRVFTGIWNKLSCLALRLRTLHFLLGNRWETRRRGNEQEERQTERLLRKARCMYRCRYRPGSVWAISWR